LDLNAIGLEHAQPLADPTLNDRQFAFVDVDRAAEAAFPTGERCPCTSITSERATSKLRAIGLEVVGTLARKWSFVTVRLSRQTFEFVFGHRDQPANTGFNSWNK
jgi:hypothetical protein